MASEIADFRASAVVCTARTLYLGSVLQEKLGTALCYVNSAYYFGPGSHRTFEEDFTIKNPAFVAGSLPFIEKADLAYHTGAVA